MTFKERYSKISKKLIKADTLKYTEDFAVQITMDDEDCGGTFFVAFTEGTYRVEPYDYVDNTANINLKADVLNKLIDKKINIEDAVNDGLVYINGSIDHVIMLFNGFEKKAPAKKPAAKKPATKKVVKSEDKKAAEKKAAEKPAKVEKPAVKTEKKETVKKSEPAKTAAKTTTKTTKEKK